MIALNMELRFRAPNNSCLDIFNRVTLFESCLNFGFARVIKNGSIILVKRHFPKLENLLNLIFKFSLGFSADIGSPLGGHILFSWLDGSLVRWLDGLGFVWVSLGFLGLIRFHLGFLGFHF